MTAYYNEFDPKAAAWLRELIRQGHIAPGDVDERSIADVRPADLFGYTQCHFFAGIGVWSYALRRAGWSDDRPVWTGSCPCQPFSAAGKGGGFDDERHLWPHFHWLIEQCRPPVVLGEQVASKDGLAWLDLVQADLEGTGYAVGAVDTCAAGVGAPHIRQRLYWAGERLADDDDDAGLEGRRQPGRERAAERPAGAGGVAGGLADDDRSGQRVERSLRVQRPELHDVDGRQSDVGLAEPESGRRNTRAEYGPVHERDGTRRIGAANGRAVDGLADADSWERQGLAVLRRAERDGQDAGWPEGSGSAPSRGEDAGFRGDGRGLPDGAGAPGEHRLREVAIRPSATNGLWRAADWLYCRDGTWRAVEPELEPLVDGSPARVGRLRGYGNAIVAPAAQAFIEAYLEAEEDRHLRLTDTSAMTTDILG